MTQVAVPRNHLNTGALGDSTIYEDASAKVGIGTTGPGYKLDVAGQINSNTALSFIDATGFVQFFRNISPRMIFGSLEIG